MRPAGAARRPPPPQRFDLDLRPTAQRLSIVTDDPQLSAYVRLAYGDVLQRGRHRSGADRAVLLTDEGATTSYAVDQCVWRAVSVDPSWLAVYGCAAAFEGAAILIVGPSGAGKTTLGLALVGAGAQLYGDEIAFVHRTKHTVTALPRRIAVRASSLNLLGDAAIVPAIRSAGALVREQAGEMYLVAREALGPVPPPQPLRLVVSLTGRGEPALQPLSPARAGIALSRQLGARPHSLDALARFTEYFSGVPAFSLTAGEPVATAAMVRETLARC